MANRTDNVRVSASTIIKGVTLDLGTFEARKGGASDSGSTVINRGGMGPREPLGGKQEPAPVTISRLRDDIARGYEKTLRQGTGRLVITVKEQGLDDEKQEIAGDLTVWTGKLKMVTTSDRDEEGNAAEMLDLEIVVGSVV